MILDVIKTIILGIIEGITEWLPISSTGHMILANEFLKLNVSAEFWEMFEVVQFCLRFLICNSRYRE